MDWLGEKEPSNGADGTDRTSLVNKMANGFVEDAARRNRALAHQFSQIEDALRILMATPLFQHDEHCQNLVARIARAGTTRDFADRVDDLHFHIKRLTAQKTGGSVPGNTGMLVLASTPIGGMVGEACSPDTGRSGRARVERYRLKI